jgi:hypothetical protein
MLRYLLSLLSAALLETCVGPLRHGACVYLNHNPSRIEDGCFEGHTRRSCAALMPEKRYSEFHAGERCTELVFPVQCSPKAWKRFPDECSQ